LAVQPEDGITGQRSPLNFNYMFQFSVTQP